MELSNTFEVKAPIEEAWTKLTDLELIAPAMPGAQLEEVEGDGAGPRLPAYEFNPPEAVHPHLSPPRAIGSLTHFGNLPFAHDA